MPLTSERSEVLRGLLRRNLKECRMAKTPFELHVSVYQWDDASVHWNVYYRHHSRDEVRESETSDPRWVEGIAFVLNDLLDDLAGAGGTPLLPTILLRRPPTPSEASAQLSFSPALEGADVDSQRSGSAPGNSQSA